MSSKIFNKINEKQMGQNKSQNLWENSKKSAEWYRIYI